MANTLPESGFTSGHLDHHATLHATHNRTFDVVAYGGADQTGVVDATAAVQSCIDAAIANGGGRVYFPTGTYTCASTLTVGRNPSVQFVGEVGSRTITQQDATPEPRLHYTGAGTRFLDLRESYSFTMRDLSITYDNAAFTGVLVDVSSVADLSYQFSAYDCRFSGTTLARDATLFDLNRLVEGNFKNCIFLFYGRAIQGRKTGPDWCNAVYIEGGRFGDTTTDCVVGLGDQWTFDTVVFEPITAGAGGVAAIACTEKARGLNIHGCGFWDAATYAGTWVDVYVDGLSFRGNFCETGTQATILKINAFSEGVDISGNTVEGTGGTFLNFTGGVGELTIGGNHVDSGIARMANFNHADSSYAPVGVGNLISRVQSSTANVTGGGLYDGVVCIDATAGARTYTLPSIASAPKGVRQIIVKSDSSANAVTVQRAGADTIEGATSVSLAAQWNKVELMSDGTRWLKMNVV